MSKYLKILALSVAFSTLPLFAHAGLTYSNAIFITTVGTTTWTVPGDWNDIQNSIEVIGGGGGGGDGGNGAGAAGGGGGAYASSTGISLTPGSSINVVVGAGGATTSSAAGSMGAKTLFNFPGGSTGGCQTSTVCAAGGGGGALNTTGVTATSTGGTTAESVGQTTYSGGDGGPGNGGGDSGGGGGGAAGPYGPGSLGGQGHSSATAGGGGGGGGASGNSVVNRSGAAGSSAKGGNGGNGPTGSGGGTGGTGAVGTSGSNGGGGGGSDNDISGTTGNGGAGTEWDSTHGAGGGGGGTGDNSSSLAGMGALYGGGGGGSEGTSGQGAQGIIVIQYTPIFTISGTLYNDEGATADTSGSDVIKLAIATGTVPGLYATTTRTSGFFDFKIPYGTGFTAATGAPMVLWLDGQASKAVAVNKASSTETMSFISNFNLYKNRVVVKHEGTEATSTTIADFARYDHDNDADIPYTANGGALTVNAGHKLYVAPGSEFAPGGAVTIFGNGPSGTAGVDGSLHLPVGAGQNSNATSSIMTLGGALSLAGSLNASSTSIFSPGAQTVTFTATTTGKIIIATSSPLTTLGATTFNGLSGGWIFGDNASTTNFNITNGTVTAPPLLSISGNYTNNGTFTHNSGTVLLNGSSPQTIAGTLSGSTGSFSALTLINSYDGNPDSDPAVIFSAAASTTGAFTATTASTTIRFLANATSTFESLVLAGGSATSMVWLRSSSAGTKWGLAVPETRSVTYVNVKDSSAECGLAQIDASGGTNVDAGKNNCWSFAAATITVSGTLYTDEEVSALTGSSKTVKLTVATSTPGIFTVSSNSSDGTYSVSNILQSDMGAGRPVGVWVDGDSATRAFIITKAVSSSANITGLNLYKNRIIVKHETTSGTSTEIADLAFYDQDNDSDIQFTANAGALTVNAGQELHIAAGSEFAPGGAVTISGNGPSGTAGVDGSLHLPVGSATSSIMTLGGALSLAGSLNASSTTIFTPGANTITFNATTSGKIIIATTSPTKTLGAVTFNGSSGGWTFGGNASTTDFTITTGSVTAPSLLSVSGNFSNSATFTHNSGTVYFTGASKTLTPGSTFNNVVMSGSYTIAPSVTWTISGNADFTGGTFTPAGGTVTMNGTSKTLTSASQEFRNLTLSGTITTTDAVAATGTMILSGSAITLGSTASTTGNATLSGTIYPQQQPVILNGIGATLTGGGTVGALEANGTYTLSGSDLTVGTSTIITNGALTVGAGRIYTSTSTLTLVGSITGAGTTTIKHSNLGAGGTLSANVSFDASGGAVTAAARTYGANLEIANGSGNAVTAGGNATSTNAFLINVGGSFTAPGATASLYVGGDYTNYGTFTHNSGKTFFNGTGVQVISGATSSSAFNNVDFSGGGAKTFSGNASTSAFTIQTGSGAVTAPSLLSISGNYSNSATFTHNSGTIYLNGTAAQTLSGTLSGSTGSFGALTILNNSGTNPDSDPAIIFSAAASTTATFTAATASTTIRFLASATSTFQNFTLTGGGATSKVWLRSSAAGTPWGLVVPGTRSITQINVKDSSSDCGFANIDASDGTNTNAGGNNCWDFVSNVASTATSSANQTFEVNQAATAMSQLTVTAGAGTGAINSTDATGDLRIAIATSTVNMLWDTTKTGAIFGGSASSSAKIAACGCVTFEGGGSVAKIDVTTNFSEGDVLTISGLRFTTFSAANASSTAIQLFLNGANDTSANAQDTLRNVAIYGKLALGAHDSGQLTTNQFDQSTDVLSNLAVFRFKYTPTGENASNTPVISLSNLSGFNSSHVTNASIYVDANNNGSVDGGDYTVGSTGSVSIAGNSGTITFGTPLAATTTSKNYILRADFTSVHSGDQIVFGLTTSNITASGTVSQISITPTGSVNSVTHFRPAGGEATPTGGAAPADTGTFGGTGQSGGTPTGGGEEGGGQTGGGSGQGGGAGGGIDFEPLLLRAFANAWEGFWGLINLFRK